MEWPLLVWGKYPSICLVYRIWLYIFFGGLDFSPLHHPSMPPSPKFRDLLTYSFGPPLLSPSPLLMQTTLPKPHTPPIIFPPSQYVDLFLIVFSFHQLTIYIRPLRWLKGPSSIHYKHNLTLRLDSRVKIG